MLYVLIQKHEKKHNIVNINSDKVTKFLQHEIRLLLYVCRKILKFHHDHVKLFLTLMNWHDLFIAILFTHSLLIEVFLNIDNRNVTAFSHDCYYVRLRWHEISVRLNYLIQVTNVYYHAFLSFRLVFFYDDFSNHKDWIFKESESRKSFHFFLLVKFVKNFVYEFLIFDFHWINAVSLVIVRSVRFERYRHMCWLKHFYCRNFFFL